LQSKTKFIILSFASQNKVLLRKTKFCFAKQSFASQNKVLLRKTFSAKPYIAKGDVKIDALPP